MRVFFSNCHGFFKGYFAYLLANSFSHEAKIFTAITVIDIAWTLSWNHLWIEADFTFVVGLIKSTSHAIPWRSDHEWAICLNHLSQMEYIVSHIYRKKNQMTDKLASFGIHSSQNLW